MSAKPCEELKRKSKYSLRDKNNLKSKKPDYGPYFYDPKAPKDPIPVPSEVIKHCNQAFGEEKQANSRKQFKEHMVVKNNAHSDDEDIVPPTPPRMRRRTDFSVERHAYMERRVKHKEMPHDIQEADQMICKNGLLDKKHKKKLAIATTKRDRSRTAKEVWAIVNERNRLESSETDSSDHSSGDGEGNQSSDELEDSESETNSDYSGTNKESIAFSPETTSIHSKHKLNVIQEKPNKVDEIKAEIEGLTRRLAKAERAAERAFMTFSSDDDHHDSDPIVGSKHTLSLEKSKGNCLSHGKKLAKKRALSLEKSKGNFLSHGKKLAKKRAEERKRKKKLSCIGKYVGPPCTIKERTTGIKSARKTYDIKCPICSLSASRLHQHLCSKHKMSMKDAKFKESEIRVMYLWAQKDKHGVAKPLPCEICWIWHRRLDMHLKGKHKFNSDQVKETMKKARETYWISAEECPAAESKRTCLSNNLGNVSNKKSAKEIKAQLTNTARDTVSYLPPNAILIDSSQKVEWNITIDEFNIYYDSGNCLLEAFEAEVAIKKGTRKAAAYRQHVEYIWTVIDPEMTVLPENALANVILVEDKYHNPTYKLVGKGGSEASTLRVRFVALRAFIRFLRRRQVYGGMTRLQLTKLSEYIQEWNSDFTDMIAQRKTDIRRIKVKRLMTPSHMIKYGRSSYVQGLIKKIDRIMKGQPEKLTKRFCQQVRDYVITDLCVMNGLRASNIIELRVSDIKEAHTSDEYPGYMVFTNSLYKTSTIYGEKVIVLPKDVFKHVQFYVETARPVLNPLSEDHLFVSSDADVISHGAIGSALTSSFKNAHVFNKTEYHRVSPTRIRCACATFGCREEGIDSGFFAKHFMKNKEDTTNIHYNLYSNHREALKLAMMMGNTFEIGGQTKTITKQDLDNLTKAIYSNEKCLPSKEEIIAWLSKNDFVDAKEMADFLDILSEIKENKGNVSTFFSSSKLQKSDEKKSKKSNVQCAGKDVDVGSSKPACKQHEVKSYPKRIRKKVADVQCTDEEIHSECESFSGTNSDDPDATDSSDTSSVESEYGENNGIKNGTESCVNTPTSSRQNLGRYDIFKHEDLVKGRKHSRITFLALTYLCKHLITRQDCKNIYKVRSFTAQEVEECMQKSSSFKLLFAKYDVEHWKYLVLNIRTKYQEAMKNGEYSKCRLWMNEAKDFADDY